MKEIDEQALTAARERTARLREKKRKRQRRRIYFLVLLLSFAIVIVLCFTLLFNIKSVKVKGQSNYTPEEIVEISGIKLGDNLITLDVKGCGKKIAKELIYVENATVTRNFPSTVEIEIEAATPTSNIQTENGYFLTSQGGKILDKVVNPKAGLLIINGAEADPALEKGDTFKSLDEYKTEDINNLITAFQNNDIGNVTYIDISNRANISFLYDGRINVEMGVATDLDYKLQFISKILKEEIGQSICGTLRLLSDSAQFVDEEALEENDRIYDRNIATSIHESDDSFKTETTAEGEGEETEETTVTEVTEEETVTTTME